MTVKEDKELDARKRLRPVPMKPLYRTGWHLFRGIFRVYFRCRVYNPERVPRQGPVILAANHESFIDPAAIGSAVPREVHYLARAPAFRFPVWGDLLRRVNAIPINQEGSAAAGLRAGLDVLSKGNALLLFPEGSRTHDGALHKFRSGVGLIAAKSGAPVVPIRVFGLYEIYGRHLLIPRPGKTAVKIGHPLTFERQITDLEKKKRGKEVYQEIADTIYEAVARLKPDND
jgi:1-acyl-sn-glycerol-3-phosphate acyltransferase